jgi:HTH-type transcriptional repressor of NAD biosynthesis genes
MKRGLIIGKFLPIHTGHLALIDFAASQCNELIVSMSYTLADPIDWQLRYEWLKELVKNKPGVKAEVSLDDFDDESLPLPVRIQRWAAFIKKRFPPIDCLFSSEQYGDPFASVLGVEHKLFDLSRSNIPVSGTLIRENPFKYWNFIPDIVRPYFVKKICFYGPESTGKSTMAKHIAHLYKTEYVPEVAREFITTNEFSVDDIIRIGNAQTQRVFEKVKTANKILCCDTDLITTQIYSKIYLNEVPQVLYDLEKQIKYDHYFLFEIDVPWVADGLRDLGDKRQEMFNWFKSELEVRNISYEIIKGSWQEREAMVRKRIEQLLNPS